MKITHKSKMWAWYDIEANAYSHLYARRFQVEMCSPDGFQGATKRGDGVIVQVSVSHVVSDDERGSDET